MGNKKNLLNVGVAFIGLLLIFGLASCSGDDDEVSLPTYSEITISPSQDTYHVGDKITCNINLKGKGSDELKKSSYWWYASWWFSNPNFKADFESFDTAGSCTSAEIELTKAGDVTLYFFGQLQYPKWDYRKVEIGKTIHVAE